jgi:hypothetical protein
MTRPPWKCWNRRIIMGARNYQGRMSDEIHSSTSTGNGGYERQDIGAKGILYFLLGLAVAGLLVYFVVDGLYSFLNKRSDAQQEAVNPLVTNAPADTRNIGTDYPQGAFPNPRLEVDERGQLSDIRIKEEQTLQSYDYIDKNAGTVRIPIDRAMDLIVQRGLPAQKVTAEAPGSGPSGDAGKKKGKK